MKIKYFYTLLIITTSIAITDVRAQEIEEVNNSKLKNVSSYLNEARIENADDAITKVKDIITISPSLDAHVKSFESYKTETEKKIRNLSEQRKDIDMSVQQLKISGVVESKEKGYVIINANGSYYAVKSDMNIGSKFSGVIIRSEGALTYTPLGGSSYTVQKYTQGTGSTSQEKYTTMTSELESYNKLYNEQWNMFKTSCLTIINSEIKNNNTTLIERHYKSGEEYLKNKDYESAYKEFSNVQNIDPNYQDIKQKVDISNNKNNTVKKINVYRIICTAKNDFLIGTSNGIYESRDGGKIWKLYCSEGYSIEYFDVVKDKIISELNIIVAMVPDKGILIGKENMKGTIDWKNITIKYTFRYNGYYEGQTKVYRSHYEIVQPDFKVKQLKFIPYEKGNMLFVEFIRQEGLREKGSRQLMVKENKLSLSGDQFYIEDGKEWLEIAEMCISPDYGNNWVAYWGSFFRPDFCTSLKRTPEIENWIDDLIDIAEDFNEQPEDAITVVKEYITEKKQIYESDINILAVTNIKDEDIKDEDIILVLTNYGLYKSCYDCDNVEEINIPKGYTKPICVFYDKNKANTIMVGFIGQGLIISNDMGVTWDEI